MLNPIIIKEIINEIFPNKPPFYYSGLEEFNPYSWSIINCWIQTKAEIITKDNTIIAAFIKKVFALNFNFSFVLYFYVKLYFF